MTRFHLFVILLIVLLMALTRWMRRSSSRGLVVPRSAQARPGPQAGERMASLLDFEGRAVVADGRPEAPGRLHVARITEPDLALLTRHGITDWAGAPFDTELLLKVGQWWVNDDKSILFKELGGGCFEIPAMYALVYQGAKVHIACGGGGEPSVSFVSDGRQGQNITVHVSHIQIPAALQSAQEAVLAQVAQAFASMYLGEASTSRLTVVFRGF